VGSKTLDSTEGEEDAQDYYAQPQYFELETPSDQTKGKSDSDRFYQVYAFDPYAPDKETKSESVSEEEEHQMESRYAYQADDDYDSGSSYTSDTEKGRTEKKKEEPAEGNRMFGYAGAARTIYDDELMEDETQSIPVGINYANSYAGVEEEDFQPLYEEEPLIDRRKERKSKRENEKEKEKETAKEKEMGKPLFAYAPLEDDDKGEENLYVADEDVKQVSKRDDSNRPHFSYAAEPEPEEGREQEKAKKKEEREKEKEKEKEAGDSDDDFDWSDLESEEEEEKEKGGEGGGGRQQATQHAGARQWNEEFQRLCHPPTFPAGSWGDNSANNKERWKQMLKHPFKVYKLCLEFAEAAKRIGTQIIKEMHLPPNEKKYPPINAGGMAGGEKYFPLPSLNSF